MQCLVGTCNRSRGVVLLVCASWKQSVQSGNICKDLLYIYEEGKNISRSGMSWSSTAILHFKLLMRQRKMWPCCLTTAKCVYSTCTLPPTHQSAAASISYHIWSKRRDVDRKEEERLGFLFQKASEQRGGGRCGLLCVRWCKCFFFSSEPCYYIDLHAPRLHGVSHEVLHVATWMKSPWDWHLKECALMKHAV